MKKIKFGNRIMALTAIFVIGGSFAHAAPSKEDTAEEIMIEWLILTEKQTGSAGCNNFPECPPPFAPTEYPEESKKQGKK